MASRDLKVTLIGEDKTGKAFGSVGKQTDDLTTKFLKFGVLAAGALAGAGIAAFAKTAATAGMNFEATLNQMAAVADVPKAALAGLSELALKMGADTKFSAQEAANAMLELAKGGLSAAQIEGGALRETLTLAAAGGLELASAGGFMSNALNTFGLSAGDAGAVAAALAGGANASTASVESLGQALGQVGPGAVNAGLSLQETVAALAAFDNAGIKGSDAGTSLKTMLSRLVPQTDKAAGAMSELGLDFTNADGSFVSLSNVAQQLQDKLGGLSEEQKATALTTIFGADATRAASVLMKEGGAGLDAYIAKTSDLGAAQRVAAATTSGTAGAVEQMKGSFETLATTVGIKLNPYMRDAALRVTEFLNSVTAALPTVIAFAGQVGSVLVAAFSGVASVVGSVVGFFREHNTAAQMLGVVATIVASLVAAAWVAKGTVATVNAAKSVVAWITTATASTTSATIQSKSTAQIVVGWAAHSVASAKNAAKVVASWVVTSAGAIAAGAVMVAQTALQVAKWAFLGAQALFHAAKVAAAWLIAMGPIGLVIAAVIGVVALIIANWDTIKRVTVDLWNAVKDATASSWEWIKGAVRAGVDFLVGLFMNFTGPGLIIKHWDAIRNATSAAWDAVKGLVSAGVEAVTAFIGGLPGRASGALSSLGSTLAGVARGAWDAFTGAVRGGIDGALDVVRGLAGRVSGVVSGFGSLLVNAGRELMSGLARGIGERISAVTDKVRAAAQRIKDLLPGSPVKTGPLTSWNNGGAGKRLMGLLAGGIDAASDLPGRAMERAVDFGDLAGMDVGGAAYVNRRLNSTATSPAELSRAATPGAASKTMHVHFHGERPREMDEARLVTLMGRAERLAGPT